MLLTVCVNPAATDSSGYNWLYLKEEELKDVMEHRWMLCVPVKPRCRALPIAGWGSGTWSRVTWTGTGGCTASTSAVWRARSRLSWCPLCQCTDRSMATPRSISAIYGSSQSFAHSWHPRFAKHGCRWAWWSWQRRRMHCNRGARCESAPSSSYDDDDKKNRP